MRERESLHTDTDTATKFSCSVPIFLLLVSCGHSFSRNTHTDTELKMSEYGHDGNCCYFHPKVLAVGVCALCLNQRLLVLASKQARFHQINSTSFSTMTPKKPPAPLPKIFALTSNLLNRLDIKQQQKPEVYCSSSTSQEESFISIKFEDNGVASWDDGKFSKMPLDQQSEMSLNDGRDKISKKIKSVVEHAKPRTTLRWQRRIGHLFQLIRWKRSGKGNMFHVGTRLEGAKVKYGWIRTLIKRRTKE